MEKIILALFLVLVPRIVSGPIKETGRIPKGNVSFKMISSFDIDQQGNFYILDSGHGSVVVLNRTGSFQNRFILDMNYPKDLIVNEEDIWVLDSHANSVERFTTKGRKLNSLNLMEKLDHPSSMLAYGNTLYISDYGNSRIIIKTDIAERSMSIPEMDSPHVLSADPPSLFISDWRSSTIFRVDMLRQRLVARTDNNQTPSLLHVDGLLCLGRYVFASDWGNSLVRIYTKDLKHIYDYPGGSEKFRNPSVIREHENKLYVLDSFNYCIRELTVDVLLLDSITRKQ